MVAVAIVFAAVVAGCVATSTTGTGGAASCAAVVRFHDQVYVGTSLRTHPPYDRIGLIPPAHLHRIGIGDRPPCVDTNHPSVDDTPTAVQVGRIDEVSPAVAIAVLPGGDVYLRRGAAVPHVLTTARWVHWILSD